MSLTILLSITASTYACPMCKDSIPNSDTQQPGALPSGFNNSVYLLLCGLIAVTGTTCGLIIKAVRDTGVREGFQVVQHNREE